MPYNPGGVFSLVASYFASPGTTIRTEQHNPVFEDVAAALSSVVLRDGRAPMTGPLNMNGFPINNVVAGSTASSVATLAQAMPIGAVIDFAGATPPAGWAMCYGQALSRSTYAALFAVISTNFGAPDSLTFNLPDLRGRSSSGKDDMGGTPANRINSGIVSIGGNVLGGSGGTQAQSIGRSQLPNVSMGLSGDAATINVTSTTSQVVQSSIKAGTIGFQSGGNFSGTLLNDNGGSSSLASQGSFTPTGTTSLNGGVSQVALINMQPTLILNKIIRVSYDV